VLLGPALTGLDPCCAGHCRDHAAAFLLNTVFAFAFAGRGPPLIRPALTEARSHLAVVLGSDGIVGVLLSLAAVVVSRWGAAWFTISLSIFVAVMTVCHVTVPARLIGTKTSYSRRDELTATVVGGAIGAVVCTPFVLGWAALLRLV